MKKASFKTVMGLVAALMLPVNTHAGTPEHPLVLVHGWFGTASYLNLIAYWNGFGSVLNRSGVEHYVASVSSFNNDEVRGRQLNNYLRSLRATTGHKQFNLVGHSQGGLTIRKTAHDMPSAVASLTTISSPHLGWKVADWALAQENSQQQVAAKLGNLLGNTVGFLSGASTDNDFKSSLEGASTAGRRAFNRRYPTAGVGSSSCATGAASGHVAGYPQRYYSYTGNRVRTNFFDPSDVLLATVDRDIMRGEQNDGFVRVCPSKFGRYLGNYPWNHLDEINQLFGVRGWFTPDPRHVLVNHAKRLAKDGL